MCSYGLFFGMAAVSGDGAFMTIDVPTLAWRMVRHRRVPLRRQHKTLLVNQADSLEHELRETRSDVHCGHSTAGTPIQMAGTEPEAGACVAEKKWGPQDMSGSCV